MGAQENARAVFKSLEEIIRAQGDAIKSLEKAIQTRPTQDDVFRITKQWTGVDEINKKLQQLQASSSESTVLWDAKWERLKKDICKDVQEQSDGLDWTNKGVASCKRDIQETKDEQKTSNADLRTSVDMLLRKVDQLQTNLSEAQKQQASTKADMHGCMEQQEEMKLMMTRVDEGLQQDKERNEFRLRELEQRTQCLKDKADATHNSMSKALKGTSITCNDRIDKVQGRVDELRTTVPSLEEDLCKIQFYLAQKPDRKEVATKEEITKIVSVHRGRVGKALEKVVSTKEHKFLQENVTGLQKDIETLKESVADKADTKDLENKPNTSDVNEVLRHVRDALQQSATKEEIKSQLSTIPSLISSCLGDFGRWQWSGRLKANGSVPWNVECINTNPKIFVWSPPKVSIVCIKSGFYKATATFISYKRPTVQLLVDGQVIASTVGASRVGNPQTKGNTMVGITCEEMVVLVPNSRITVKVDGDNPIKGFLALQCMDSK